MTHIRAKRSQKTKIKPDHYERLRAETHILYRCYNRSKLLLYVGMTNNPEKLEAFEDSGIHVESRISLVIQSIPDNERYLKTKKDGMGHMI